MRVETTNLLEIHYTLSIMIEEMNEMSYEITYTPEEDDGTAKVLGKLPDYFGEPLSFQSDAVSFRCEAPVRHFLLF